MIIDNTHEMIKRLPDETKVRLFNDLFETLDNLANWSHRYVHHHDNPDGPLPLDVFLAHLRGATRSAQVNLGEIEGELEKFLEGGQDGS